MSEDRTGRELTPRPTEPEGVVAPREPSLPSTTKPALPDDRFYAGDQAHTVGLTEERAAQIVRQSSNARSIAFLGVLFFVLAIPIYWLYAIGLPVVGIEGALPKEADAQYVTDVRRGYALYLANCARCHDRPEPAPPGNGLGNVGPPLNDQMKLYNTINEQGLPGRGHLNPDYLRAVLREGGRYVCGDPNSVMPAWEDPKGPLNYREVQEIIAFLLASKDIDFTYVPAHVEGGATLPPPVQVEGWRDPDFTPAPGASPVPACWRAPTGGGAGAPATAAPIANPGTPESPRVIEVEGTASLTWVDPASDQQLSSIAVVEGETVEFRVVNDSGLQHNMHIGAPEELATAPADNPLPGTPTFTEGTQTFTYTFDQPGAELQFACTVPGHYPTMNGDFAFQPAGQPGASPGASPAASPGASPAASPGGSPAASAAPSAPAASPAATP